MKRFKKLFSIYKLTSDGFHAGGPPVVHVLPLDVPDVGVVAVVKRFSQLQNMGGVKVDVNMVIGVAGDDQIIAVVVVDGVLMELIGCIGANKITEFGK